jgi:hypothetical protein
MFQKMKPAAIGARPASASVDWHIDSAEDTHSQNSEQDLIRAELVGSDTATAAGITVIAFAPVLTLCRALIDAGHEPRRLLEAYRGEVLCLRVKTIGEAALLTVKTMGNGAPGFTVEGTAGRATASPVRPTAGGAAL